MAVSIVATPRERYSTIQPTLESLFDVIPEEVEIVVVEGGSPRGVKHLLNSVASRGLIDWKELPGPLVPNVARNIGIQATDSELVVFLGSDVLIEAVCLEALLAWADSHAADVVASLICIGPPRAEMIDHAGGILLVDESRGYPQSKEQHRLMNVPRRDFDPYIAPLVDMFTDFHCFLVRCSFVEKMGPLDERLNTREQTDFALRVLANGGRVAFARDAVFTYMTFAKFSLSDLSYRLFRWADSPAVRSIEAFESSCGVSFEQKRIRLGWIAKHRRRAVGTFLPFSTRVGSRLIFWLLLGIFERCAEARANVAQINLAAAPISRTTAEDVIASLPGKSS